VKPIFPSSTVSVPTSGAVPRHVAIIMDGNGRWATSRRLPRVAGHARGVEAVRTILEACAKAGVEFLTLFAFSSENWRRPVEEVSVLMRLFISALEREVDQLHANGIRLRVVGELDAFEPRLRTLIRQSEARTAGNQRMTRRHARRWRITPSSRAIPSNWTRRSCPPIWPCLMRRSPICSSVPAASSG